MNLLITIDTEEDDAWSGKAAVTTENAAYVRRFQDLCARYGFRPTWLCNEPMLADRRLVEALAPAVREGRAEIGAHLHPWSCPPFDRGGPEDPTEQVYPSEIPVEVFRAKMERIVARTEEAFGRRPVSYRAGRWGFDAAQIEPLLALGIRIDCSVTPHLSWRGHRGRRTGAGGPDFRGAPDLPYWVDARDVRRPGATALLELPLTVLHGSGPFAAFTIAWPVLDRVRYSPLGRVINRLGWSAQPCRAKHDTALESLLALERKASALALPYVMLMFHSSELMPGGSPYNPDARSIEELYTLFEALFTAWTRRGLVGATLQEFARPYLDGEMDALRGAA